MVLRPVRRAVDLGVGRGHERGHRDDGHALVLRKGDDLIALPVVPHGDAVRELKEIAAGREGDQVRLLGEMETRLASLRAVELKLPNRTNLEIEFDKLRATYSELEGVDLEVREKELERSLTRLGYRMGELELAIEDFRTNTRPRRAAPHVEEDSQKVADELAAFVILSRC